MELDTQPALDDLMRELSAELIPTLAAGLAHALNNREHAVAYAITYGRGQDEERTDSFVGMYVNQLTLDYGERGREAVRRFMGEAFEKGLIPAPVDVVFVGEETPAT